ncbi:MAG: DUF2851 family protein [Nitrospinae bacterium]|nr:DUF2851 family protein [Nitrospinota bacterium]
MEDQMTVPKEYFTGDYLKFTSLYSRLEVREEPPRPGIQEKVIRCIWNDQLFKTRELRTTEGEKLEILFPGYWNFGSGPDFAKAIVKVDGKTIQGDVELHVYSTDWKSHNHSGNPDYDNVVLHVFMWKGRGKRPSSNPLRPSPRLPGAHIFELELKSFLKKGLLELDEQLDFDNYPVINKFNYGRCHEPLAKLSREKMAFLLSAAGDARINIKMNRFHDRVILSGYEQTFYEGVAEALGYPNNKKPFQALAERVPIVELKNLLPVQMKDNERVLHIQAVLFGVSGLLDSRFPDLDAAAPGGKDYFSSLFRLWEKYKDRFPETLSGAEIWKLGGIRPANYPYRRIAALSRLVVRHWRRGMFADYIDLLKSAISISRDKGYTTPPATARKIERFFCVESPDYWSDHYSPNGKKLSRPQQVLGPDRSREITVNIAIPIGLIYARAGKSTSLEAALGFLFQSGKSPAENKQVRFMKQYILGDKKDMVQLLSSDKQTQGLMQVYQDFCAQSENNCTRCPFPRIVKEYFA